MGRFINADIHAATGQGLLGNNMFAYCGNNPVNRTDTLGEDWWHWAVAAAVVVAAGAVLVATAGGAAGAVVALTCVANGVAAGTTASTVAAGVFIGSSTALAASAYAASIETDSAEEFAAYGESAMYATGAGGLVGGVSGYNMAQSQNGPQCFIAGTLVQTENGVVAIEDVTIGSLVWSWDEATGKIELNEVVETYVSETYELIHLFVNDEEIVTTPTHPFYSPSNGWTEAINLQVGDNLVLLDGDYVVIEEIQLESLDVPVCVFNLQISDSHTYYVTELGILVHNKCSGSYEIEFKSGKNYVGKGSEARMNVSARIHSTVYNDPVVSMKWEYAPDTQTAFVDEYFKMAVRGVNNPNTYNIIWSPGRKIFFNNWV